MWPHQVALVVKNPPVNPPAGDIRDAIPYFQSMGQEDPMGKEMATHSSILAWRLPWTEEPAGLQSIVRRGSDTTEATAHTHGFIKVTNGNFSN